MNSVFISIKPQYTKLIESRQKNYEFRKYLIKDIKYMYVYESITSSLKYIMEIDNPISSPNKIDEKGIGNKEFNNLNNEYKYAYPIVHLYKLNKEITLTELKSKYKFFAPQKYTYTSTYPLLIKDLELKEKTKIF